MEAIGGRRIKSVEEYLYLFPRPIGNDTVIKKGADVSDTVRFIQKKMPQASWQTEKFARFIKGNNTENSCRKIWQWLYDHIPYKKDEEGIEQIRSPRRLVYEGSKTGVDCDCYSFTISTILYNLNIPHFYRITKYVKADGSEPRWQHIYIVVPKNGKLDRPLTRRSEYIVIDCVKNNYDSEEPYYECIDFKADMRLDYLDGLDGNEFEVPNSMDAKDMAAIYEEEELGKIGQWVKKAVKKVGNVAKKGFQVVKKVGNSPLRVTFLAAMKINFLNVARRLRYGYLSDDQGRAMGLNLSKLAHLRKVVEKAEKIFEKAGGKKQNLKLAILKGKGNKDKKVALSGTDLLYGDMDEEERQIIHGLGELGDLGVAPLAAGFALVTPIFTALAKALKGAKGLFPAGHPENKNFESDSDTETTTTAATIPVTTESLDQTSNNVSVVNQQESASTTNPLSPDESSPPLPITKDNTVPATPVDTSTPTSQGDPSPAVTTTATVPEKTDTPAPEGFFSKAGAWIKSNPLPTALLVAGVGTGIYFMTKQKKAIPKQSEVLQGIPSDKKKPKKKSGKKSKPKTFKAIKIK